MRAPQIACGAALRRRHPQVAAAGRCAAGLRDGVHSRSPIAARCASPRRSGCALDCSLLRHRAAGLQPQPEHRRDRRPGVARLAELEREERERAGAGSAGAVRDERHVTNVVLMGMGEPLANFRNVVPALDILLDDFGFDLSRRRVTLSTSGLVPQIYRLAAGDQRRAGGVAARARRRAAQRAGADQPQASDRRAARRPAGTISTSRTAAASPSST